MRYLISFLIAVALVCPAIGQVNGAEYFIDTDPGYGKATYVSITSGNTISKDINVALSSVNPGFHIVSLRAKDAQGQWSHTYNHSFYVIPTSGVNVAASEYYIDTDPGYGKAVNIPVAITGDSLKYVVPLTSYSTGFHTMGLRCKDNAGRWSHTTQHAFYINESGVLENISSLKYYFTGNGATDSIYTYQVPTPSTSVDLNFKAELNQLVGDREYTMHIWAVNAKGVRSEVYIKKVKACSGDVANAGFDFVQDGTQVSFIDNSIGGSKYLWDFGDGKKDSIANPLHVYTTVGIYNVKLIVSNFCNSDTIGKVVSVAGLKNIFTNHGGNSGRVTVNVTGAGFTIGTQLYLHKNGQADIYGDTLNIINQSSMSTTFNFTNETSGLWDVIVAFPGGKKDTLKNGFTIEDANAPKLWVNITGDYVLRVGFNQVYSITYGNTGNTDALFVPMAISGLPLGTDIEIMRPEFKVDSLLNLDTLHLSSYSIPRTINDSTSNSSFRIFFLSRIPAGSTKTLNVIFHLPFSTPLHIYPEISVILGKPLMDYELSQASMRSLIDFTTEQFNCISEVNRVATDFVVGEIVDYDPTGVLKCYKGKDELLETLAGEYVSDPEKGVGEKILDINEYLLTIIPTSLSCLRATLNVAAVEAPLLAAPILTLSAEIYLAELAVQKTLELPGHVKEAVDILSGCAPAFQEVDYSKIAKAIWYAITGNAWDPNEKYGPGSSTPQHYTNDNPINYSINFENDPAANLNAQTVTVIDTLNKNYYDYSSFGFTSVTVGDSIYSLPNPVKSFLHDFNFATQYGVKARVTANFDTATGIAKWRFLSIDPSTNQATTDALAGFLPPDVISPKGQGYVSYTVNLNKNITTGDFISNKATIKFDYNPDITTNEWSNIFDLIEPTSQVQATPSEVYDTIFTVRWNGSDNLSGVQGYDVYYKVNDGPYQLWQANASITQHDFTGQKDSTYSFFSISKDFAGNIEPLKTNAERVVTVRISDTANRICAGDGTSFSIASQGAGYTYQWQVNMGSGFVDIASNNVYTGVNTTKLILTSPPTMFSNYKYRCKISKGAGTSYSRTYTAKFVSTWLGTAGNAWETPANWSCNVVPDENTDVIIPKTVPATPVLNINGTCKSLTMNKESKLLMKSGVHLDIKGKR